MIVRRSGLGLIVAGIASSLLLPATASAAKLKLSPQMVMEQTLKQGRDTKAADLQAKRANLFLETARSRYDFNLDINIGYEVDQAESLTGLSNPEDRSTTGVAALRKKISTGTEFTVGYDFTNQSSVLNPLTSQTRPPKATLNSVVLTIRQPVLRNYFGYADRLAVEAAEARIQTALEVRAEDIETVLLDVMTLYWDAYVAQQQLKESEAARDRYEQLVKNVRRRSGLNLVTPGELPRLVAEAEIAEARVKQSSTAYLNAIDALLTSIQMPSGDDIEFDIPKELPPVPRLDAKDPETLRAVRIARLSLENFERDLESARASGLPQLDVVAAARSTGVDPSGARSTTEMASGTRPTYFIGVEFSTPLNSSLVRGELADRRIAIEQGRNNLEIAREAVRDRLRELERTVAMNFAVVQANTVAVESRARVVRELEASYRQGRLPLVELIRAFNELSASQQDKARATGNYHISLNALAAARDELVASSR